MTPSVLMRATDIIKRPVVTLAGEDVAQIKDIVYAGSRGQVAGFTLNGRGLLAGPLKTALAWRAVHGLGPDAIMVTDATVFDEIAQVVSTSGGDGNVLGSRVLSDSGQFLGVVTEVILEIAATADVVGYEIDSSEALTPDRRKVLIPLPDTLAVSSESLIVPAAAVEFVSDDLSGFGASVEAFRRRLRESEGHAVADPAAASTVADPDAADDPKDGA